jgi:hypothetical protein
LRARRPLAARVRGDGPEAIRSSETFDGPRWLNLVKRALDASSWQTVVSDAPEVGYDESRDGLVRRDNGAVDLQASVGATSPFPVRPEETRLPLETRH